MKGLFLAVAFAAALAIWTLNARAEFPATGAEALNGATAQSAPTKTASQR